MHPSFVHRNIKSRNIFLDEEFNAKIGNFGMAGCVEDDTKEPDFNSTNPASWSHGYVAPEAHQGIVFSSTNMFSFGVVLLTAAREEEGMGRVLFIQMKGTNGWGSFYSNYWFLY